MKLSPASLSLLCAALTFPAALCAQSAAEIPKSLPRTDQVIARLGELNTLPSGEWRFHAGDVPHGESPSLDDSGWAVVKPGTEGPNEAAWYRQWIEVPKTSTATT